LSAFSKIWWQSTHWKFPISTSRHLVLRYFDPHDLHWKSINLSHHNDAISWFCAWQCWTTLCLQIACVNTLFWYLQPSVGDLWSQILIATGEDGNWSSKLITLCGNVGSFGITLVWLTWILLFAVSCFNCGDLSFVSIFWISDLKLDWGSTVIGDGSGSKL